MQEVGRDRSYSLPSSCTTPLPLNYKALRDRSVRSQVYCFVITFLVVVLMVVVVVHAQKSTIVGSAVHFVRWYHCPLDTRHPALLLHLNALQEFIHHKKVKRRFRTLTQYA